VVSALFHDDLHVSETFRLEPFMNCPGQLLTAGTTVLISRRHVVLGAGKAAGWLGVNLQDGGVREIG